MNYALVFIILGIAIGSTLIPIILGIRGLGGNPLYLKLLLALCAVSFACDASSAFIIFLKIKININYAGNFYRFAEFGLLLAIYYLAFDSRRFLVPFICLGLTYTVFLIVNITYLQADLRNSYSNVFSALAFILLSVGFFFKLMKDLPAHSIYELPVFWFNTAILVYFAGNLFLFALTEILDEQIMVFWNFHNFLQFCKNIIFAIAMYKGMKHKDQPLANFL